MQSTQSTQFANSSSSSSSSNPNGNPNGNPNANPNANANANPNANTNPNPNPNDDDDLGIVDADAPQLEELAGGHRLSLNLKALVNLCFEERPGNYLPASACRVFVDRILPVNLKEVFKNNNTRLNTQLTQRFKLEHKTAAMAAGSTAPSKQETSGGVAY